MSLVVIFAVCLGTFALLQFGLLSQARGAYRMAIGREKISLARKVAGFEVLRSAALLCTLSAALAGAIALWLQSLGGSTVAEAATTLERLRGWKDLLDQFSLWFGAFALVVIVIALWRLTASRAAAETEQALMKAIDLELARVRADRDAGRWEDLPANEAMVEIEGKMQEMVQLHGSIDRLSPGGRRTQRMARSLLSCGKKLWRSTTGSLWPEMRRTSDVG
jgi:hypothetical protein